MTETVTNDRPSVAKPVSRPPAKPANVSESALAPHLYCSRAYIGKLEAEGVIKRQARGSPLNESRIAYLRYCGASGGNRGARRPEYGSSVGQCENSDPMLVLADIEEHLRGRYAKAVTVAG
jgi:hypothetical protein